MILMKSLTRLWNNQKTLCIVWMGVIVYTVFFTTISFLRYESFSYSDFDLAIFVHECWKILHGSANISVLNNAPIWGDELELISFPNSLVFYFFACNPKILLFLQSFLLGAAAIPIFLIARPKLHEQLAACLAISYLFYPPIWFANLYEFNPFVYTTFTLLMTFYFFQEKRFKLFMFFILLSLIHRGDVCIVTVMFGFYALFSKRPWRWVLGPSVLSVLWLVVGLLVIIPKFKNGVSYDLYYPQFGKGFAEIIKNIVLHPGMVYQSFVTRENMKYFIQILYPVGFFSLLGLKEFLICALALFQHLISIRYQEHTIHFQYTSVITPFVYISAAYGMARFIANRRVSAVMCVLPILLSVLSNCMYGPISNYHYYVKQLSGDDEDAYKKEILKRIPNDAGVVSSFEFSPMLAGRKSYYSFHFIYSGLFWDVPYQTPGNIDYALINFNDPRLLSFYRPGSDTRVREFLDKGRFGVVDMVNNVVLFKKGYQGVLKLYEIRHPKDLHRTTEGIVQVQNPVKLTALDVRQERKNNKLFLNFVFHWRAMAHINHEIMALMVIVNGHGEQVYNKQRILCYGVYPSYRWLPEQEIVEYYDMLLPGSLPAGEYKVYMALFPKGSNIAYPLTKLTAFSI